MGAFECFTHIEIIDKSVEKKALTKVNEKYRIKLE